MSTSTVRLYMVKYELSLRTKAEAAYVQHGKSFKIRTDLNESEKVLYGLGLGLYWGEGNKASIYSVRLGNTDPHLIRIFVKFLKDICGIQDKDIKFGLQVFNDSDPILAKQFWLNTLGCGTESFHPTISVIQPQGLGTYGRKNKTGVLQVYVNNKRFKDWMLLEIGKYAEVAQW